MATASTSKGELRRQQLIDSAVGLFHEQGLSAVRHRSVADRAGVPLSATTYYFSSIDELLTIVVRESTLTEHQAMQDRVDRIHLRRRGAEATAELLVDLIIAPEGKVKRDVLVARMERITASARVQELRDVHKAIAPDYIRMIGEALRKSGRVVTHKNMAHLTALVNGTLLASLLFDGSDPREDVREALVPVIDVLAPLVVSADGSEADGGEVDSGD